MASTAGRNAVKVDWTRITTTLGLKGQSQTQLLAFKKRSEEARRRLAQLSEQPTNLDLGAYRAVLKNQSVVDEIEKSLREFKAKTVDVGRQVRVIEEFEKKAVVGAEETRARVLEELKGLEGALEDIRSARPVEDLTTNDVVAARPDIDDKTESLVKKGQWNVPGYKEKFGDLSAL